MLNICTFVGRLARDPELKYTQANKPVANFTIAVDRTFKSGETDFIDIVVWGQSGENCANYLSKGKLVAVSGELHVRNYETQDGQKRKACEIVANNVQFLSPKEGKKQDDEMPF